MSKNFYDVWICQECGREVEDPLSPPVGCGNCEAQQSFKLSEEKSTGLPDKWKSDTQ